MKHIILPSDFSDNAWKAMSYAANLYHDTPCIFQIIHSYDLPTALSGTGGVNMPINPIPMSVASANAVEKLVKKFKKLNHHKLSTFYSQSTTASVINIIQKLEKELESTPAIFMGTVGVTGLGKRFFGSVTTRVIKNCHSPVICVPKEAHIGTPKKIMFAMDELTISSKKEILPLIELAEEWKSTISTVHIMDANTETKDKTPEEIVSDFYLNRIDHNYYNITGDNIEKEIAHFAETNEIDLIAMIKREKGFWQSLFQSSLTEKMTLSTHIPLLILKDL